MLCGKKEYAAFTKSWAAASVKMKFKKDDFYFKNSFLMSSDEFLGEKVACLIESYFVINVYFMQ